MKNKILSIILVILIGLGISSCSNKEKEAKRDYIFNIAGQTSDKVTTLYYKHLTQSNNFLSVNTRSGLYEVYEDYVTNPISLEMAKDYPIDVTSEYVGEKWNIESGEKGRVWKIDLRDDICWENGEKITADSIIESLKLSEIIPTKIYNYRQYIGEEVEFSDLGIFSKDDSLVVVYDSYRTMSTVCDDFTSVDFHLVNEELYNKSYVTNEDGSTTNIYGTTPENYLSYGPYKLVQLDETGVRLIKNENWFGYKDIEEELYQTEEIVVDYLEDYSQSYNLLVEGKYDFIFSRYSEYDSETGKEVYKEFDVDEKYIMKSKYSPSSTLPCLMINPDYDQIYKVQEEINAKKEEGETRINKTIITIPEFREALSLALDRNKTLELISKYYSDYFLKPTLLPDYCYNLFTNECIHQSSEYQEILKEFYQEDISEYNGNIELAKEKFTEAYNIALEKGYLKEDEIISLTFGTRYGVFNQNHIKEVLISQLLEVVKGTPLEGKIEFETRLLTQEFVHLGWCYTDINWYSPSFATYDNNYIYYYYLNHNHIYYYLSGYIEERSSYNYAINYKEKELSIDLDKVIDINGNEYNNVTLSTSVYNWVEGFNYNIVEGYLVIDGKITENSIEFIYEDNVDLTNKIAAKCEVSVLEDYCMIPVMDHGVTIIVSDKIKYPIEYNYHYLFNLKYLTYK